MLPQIGAASASVVAVPPWQALFDEAPVTSGQSVLLEWTAPTASVVP